MPFIWKEQGQLRYRASGLIEAAGGAAHGFSNRSGGVSGGVWAGLNLGAGRGDAPENVAENRRRFLAAVGAGEARTVKARQVHGDRVYAVTEAPRASDAPIEADGLVTDVPGLALTVMTADCLPVLLYDPRRRCVSAIHSGWRGTALAICARAAERMIENYGCRAEDILAAVGPAISACCFETDGDVPAAMRRAFGAEAEPFIRAGAAGKFFVDLKGIAVHTLVRAGLDPAHIDVCPDCTACRTGVYWSHRRMGAARGSMASVIALA